jgi:6-phospho 3-hexuloisomerase
MEVLKEAMRSIVKHTESVVDSLNEEEVNSIIDCLLGAKKVFVYGAGRSGLVAKAFAMRLMHLGINVYVIGEILNPAIEEGDCLVTISGSGETISIVNAAKIAKKANAKIAAITSYPNSSLGKIADYIVVVKGRTKLEGEKDFLMRQIKGEHYSLAPLGTLFEVSALIFLDGLIAELMTRLGITEEDMRVRHATIE